MSAFQSPLHSYAEQFKYAVRQSVVEEIAVDDMYLDLETAAKSLGLSPDMLEHIEKGNYKGYLNPIYYYTPSTTKKGKVVKLYSWIELEFLFESKKKKEKLMSEPPMPTKS